jgi:hypothetical protein
MITIEAIQLAVAEYFSLYVIELTQMSSARAVVVPQTGLSQWEHVARDAKLNDILERESFVD